MFFLISQNKGHLWSTFKKTLKLFCMIKYLFLSTKETGIYIFIRHITRAQTCWGCVLKILNATSCFSQNRIGNYCDTKASLELLAGECNQLLLYSLRVTLPFTLHPLSITSASPRYSLWHCSWGCSTSELRGVHMQPHMIQWHGCYGYFLTCIKNIMNIFEFLTVTLLLACISHCEMFNQRNPETFCIVRNNITVWYGFDFILPKLRIV